METFELRSNTGEVFNQQIDGPIGDIHFAGDWQVTHDDGAIVIYAMRHDAIRLVAKAAIMSGRISTRVGRNGVPDNDEWNAIAFGLSTVLGTKIAITGDVSDDQVTDDAIMETPAFLTFDLESTSGAVTNVATSREQELRRHRDDETWQVCCAGDRVTIYARSGDTDTRVIGRANRASGKLVDRASLDRALSQDYHWILVEKGLAAARTKAPNKLRDTRRSARDERIPWTTRRYVVTAIGAVMFGVLVLSMIAMGAKLGTFPLFGPHVVFVPIATLLTPYMVARGIYIMTSKEAMAERPTKSSYARTTDPLTSKGLLMAIVGFMGSFYPFTIINFAPHLQPDVPFEMPASFVAKAPPPTPVPTPTPPPPPPPPASLAEAIRLARPELGDGADNAGAKAIARYASQHLAWDDVTGGDETTLPLVLKDSDAERGKRLCATGTLFDIERSELERRPVWIGALRTAEGDDVRFIATGSSGSLVKRSTATLCGVVTGKADKAVMLVGMFDLPENARPAVER